MFNRTTKSVVQGNRLEQAIQRPGGLKDTPEPVVQDPHRSPKKKRSGFLLIAGILALMIVLGGALYVLKQQPAVAATGTVPDGKILLAIPVETSLGSQTSTGDILRLYSNGSPIPSLRYIQVWSTAADSVTVLVTESQLSDYMAAEAAGSVLPVLMIHQDPEAAEGALQLQQAWNSPEISLEVAEAIDLSVSDTLPMGAVITVEPQGAIAPEVTYTSSDESIISVSNDGTITANSSGQAEVTVQCGGQQAVCIVTALQPAEELSFESKEISIGVGGNAALTPTVRPEDCTEILHWTSSDESVAVVDDTGSVIGIAEGEAEITVSGKTASASYIVTVAVEATDIRISRKSMILDIGGTGALAAVVTPEDASDNSVVWTSSDESVAVVDAEGAVTALSEGETEITASCGTVSASCSVTVTAPDPGDSPAS